MQKSLGDIKWKNITIQQLIIFFNNGIILDKNGFVKVKNSKRVTALELDAIIYIAAWRVDLAESLYVNKTIDIDPNVACSMGEFFDTWIGDRQEFEIVLKNSTKQIVNVILNSLKLHSLIKDYLNSNSFVYKKHDAYPEYKKNIRRKCNASNLGN